MIKQVSLPLTKRQSAVRYGLVAIIMASMMLLLGLLLLWAANTGDLGPADPRVITIASADFCIADPKDSLDRPACTWKTTRLPKLWSIPRQDEAPRYQDAWFRFKLHLDKLPDANDGLALFALAFDRAGRFLVNGENIRSIGSLTEEPLPLNWNRSQIMTIPTSLLHVGDNEVTVLQRTYGWATGDLGRIRVGPELVLRDLYERRVFWQNDLVEILAATTAAFGLFILGVWLGRRKDTAYAWFGLNCFCWVVLSLDFFVSHPPLPALLWERLIVVLDALRGVLMAVFILRYCGRRLPRLEAAMWLYVAVGAANLFFNRFAGSSVDLWFLSILSASLYFSWILVREGLRRSLLEGCLLGVAAITRMVLSGYDLWIYGHGGSTENIFLAHLSVPIYLLVVGLILVRHFVGSLNGFESLTAHLEARVAEKSAELEVNYARLATAQATEALADERGRIMQEMHDGIGSQLTLALSVVNNLPVEPVARNSVTELIQHSIDDLQMIVDSLEPVENDLLTVLGTLRYRMQDRLKGAGIELEWNVVDLPPLPMLTPHGILSILRIVQEAFANALKHSGAKRIELFTGIEQVAGKELALVGIVDDGRGITGPREGGRGMTNMRARAKALGGTLDIGSLAGRTEIVLTFPTMRAA